MAANRNSARPDLAARLSNLARDPYWIIFRNRNLQRDADRPRPGDCNRHHAWRSRWSKAHQLLVLWDQDFLHTARDRTICAHHLSTDRDPQHRRRRIGAVVHHRVRFLRSGAHRSDLVADGCCGKHHRCSGDCALGDATIARRSQIGSAGDGGIIIGAAIIGAITFLPATAGALKPLLPYQNICGFLILLPLIWASLRGNQRAAATAAFILCGLAAWGFADATGMASSPNSLLLLLAIAISISVR